VTDRKRDQYCGGVCNDHVFGKLAGVAVAAFFGQWRGNDYSVLAGESPACIES